MESYFNPRKLESFHSSVVFFPPELFFGGCNTDLGVSDMMGNAEQVVALGAESLVGRVWHKSLHPRGCREVQEALSNGDNSTRAAIAFEMRGHAWQAVESPHANHVLQKCIVELTPEASQPIIDELMSRRGAAAYLARHRYGCRVVERLVEHCRPEQLGEMICGILAEVESLFVDHFGNFVVQHLFEYGSDDTRRQLAEAVLARLQKLSSDPRGVAVVAKALEFSPVEERVALARALLRKPGQLVRIATQHQGKEVALALIRMKDPEGQEARKCFGKLEARGVLASSRYGRELIKVLDN
jgi:hypothetical protein